LSAFISALQAREPLYPALSKHCPNHLENPIRWRGFAEFLPSARTDADARFRIQGFAKETLLQVRLEGAPIDDQPVYVIPRGEPHDSERWLRMAQSNHMEEFLSSPQVTVHWNGLELAVPPGKVVVGTVRDRTTAKPIPGAIVESYQLARSDFAQDSS